MEGYGYGNYNLEERFGYLNEMCFAGGLEDAGVRLGWCDDPTFIAVVWIDRCPEHFTYGKDGFLISVCKGYYGDTMHAMDSILLHEMVHVWCMKETGELDHEHGDDFMGKAAEMKRFGFDIRQDATFMPDIRVRIKTRNPKLLMLYFYPEGKRVWMPVHHDSVDHFYQDSLERAKEDGVASALLEVKDCRLARMRPRKSTMSRYAGYLVDDGFRKWMLEGGSATVLGFMGIRQPVIDEFLDGYMTVAG